MIPLELYAPLLGNSPARDESTEDLQFPISDLSKLDKLVLISLGIASKYSPVSTISDEKSNLEDITGFLKTTLESNIFH